MQKTWNSQGNIEENWRNSTARWQDDSFVFSVITQTGKGARMGSKQWTVQKSAHSCMVTDDKASTAIQWEKNDADNKWHWVNWISTQKASISTSHWTKITLRWITVLKVKGKTIALLKDNIGGQLFMTWIG